MLLDTVRNHIAGHDQFFHGLGISLTLCCWPQLEYNAHVSGLDALWAGLPLVTCAGEWVLHIHFMNDCRHACDNWLNRGQHGKEMWGVVSDGCQSDGNHCEDRSRLRTR